MVLSLRIASRQPVLPIVNLEKRTIAQAGEGLEKLPKLRCHKFHPSKQSLN